MNPLIVLLLLWVCIGSLAALVLGWAFHGLADEQTQPPPPRRRDVRVVTPPYDWSRERGVA